MSKSKDWHSRKNLQDWFDKLTPEQRIRIAFQVEKFRRGAKFVESSNEDQIRLLREVGRKRDLEDADTLSGE